jgi:hypothetical protein
MVMVKHRFYKTVSKSQVPKMSFQFTGYQTNILNKIQNNGNSEKGTILI